MIRCKWLRLFFTLTGKHRFIVAFLGQCQQLSGNQLIGLASAVQGEKFFGAEAQEALQQARDKFSLEVKLEEIFAKSSRDVIPEVKLFDTFEDLLAELASVFGREVSPERCCGPTTSADQLRRQLEAALQKGQLDRVMLEGFWGEKTLSEVANLPELAAVIPAELWEVIMEYVAKLSGHEADPDRMNKSADADANAD